MDTKYAKLAEYFSLFVTIAITIIAIYNKQTTVFYIVYLFWWDELIKTGFDRLRYHFKKDQLQNPAEYLSNSKSRLFMLVIYWVFIFVFFCLILDWNNTDLILENFTVLFFRNPLFNFTLGSIFLRELYLYLNKIPYTEVHHLLSRGIITLHVSLILGIFISFFIKRDYKFLENYTAIATIVPFLLFKIYFEIQEIKDKYTDKHNLSNE